MDVFVYVDLFATASCLLVASVGNLWRMGCGSFDCWLVVGCYFGL